MSTALGLLSVTGPASTRFSERGPREPGGGGRGALDPWVPILPGVTHSLLPAQEALPPRSSLAAMDTSLHGQSISRPRLRPHLQSPGPCIHVGTVDACKEAYPGHANRGRVRVTGVPTRPQGNGAVVREQRNGQLRGSNKFAFPKSDRAIKTSY